MTHLLHKRRGPHNRSSALPASLRWAVAVALLGTIVYGIGHLLWSPHRTLRLLSDFSMWVMIVALLVGSEVAIAFLLKGRKTAALKIALVLAFIICFLRYREAHPVVQSTENMTASEERDLEALQHPKVLQRFLAQDVKESGPEMKATYSGFADDGRAFTATENSDEGTCMVTTPEDARLERREFHARGTVEPIFLVQYDDGQGGSFWEITQETRAGDINFTPPTTKDAVVEESCGVSVILH